MTHLTTDSLDYAVFQQQGLNLSAVLNIEALPHNLTQWISEEERCRYSQLLILGHGGTQLWQVIQAQRHLRGVDDPIDQFVGEVVANSLGKTDTQYTLVYPGPRMVDLQAFGRYLGWHQDTPFLLGMHQQWGTWFAYRGLVLMSSTFVASEVILQSQKSQCECCEELPCISACPANAISTSHFSMDLCVAYRKTEVSKCAKTCLAREACPVATQHRYSKEQMDYHYELSRLTIMSL